MQYATYEHNYKNKICNANSNTYYFNLECFNKNIGNTKTPIKLIHQNVTIPILKKFLHIKTIKIPKILHNHVHINKKNLMKTLYNVKKIKNNWIIFFWNNYKNIYKSKYIRTNYLNNINYFTLTKEYSFSIVILQAVEYKAITLISNIVRNITLHKYGGLYINSNTTISNHNFLLKDRLEKK